MRDPDSGKLVSTTWKTTRLCFRISRHPISPFGTLPPAVWLGKRHPLGETCSQQGSKVIESDEGSKVTEQSTPNKTLGYQHGKQRQTICKDFSLPAQSESRLIDCSEESLGLCYTHAVFQDRLSFRLFPT